VDGARLLEDLATVFRRHLVLPAGGAEAMALWTLHSHALDATSISPILCFSSPEKRCGKSTALDVLEQVVPRPIPSVNISPAALYRSIQAWEPTLLIDEFDARLEKATRTRSSEEYSMQATVETSSFFVWSRIVVNPSVSACSARKLLR
jgi:putative DNA primase/helicase